MPIGRFLSADRYRFHTPLGSGEKVAVWIDGRLAHSAGFRSLVTDLVAEHRHHIRIEYINPDGRVELKLLLSSRVTNPISLNIKRLHPARRQFEGSNERTCYEGPSTAAFT